MQGPRTRPRKPTRRGEVLFAGKSVILVFYVLKFRALTSFGCSRWLVQWRRYRLGRTIRRPDRGLENGRTDEQTSVWCRSGRLKRFTIRCRRSRRSVVPEQHRKVNKTMILSGFWLVYVCLTSFLSSRYDPQTNQWSCDVAPTTSCRTSVGVAVLDGYLYAVGGQDGVQCLNHVERLVLRKIYGLSLRLHFY